MKIQWCDIHSAPPEVDGVFCMGEGNGPCRFVPMRLIPDNAETVERIAGVLTDFDLASLQKHKIAVAILDALDGETP